MPDDEMTDRDEGTGGEFEEEIGDDTSFKDDAPMPPGAEALHDLHEAHSAVKEAAESHEGRQEHPRVQKIIAKVKQAAEDMCAMIRDEFASIYPDHPGPEEDDGTTEDDVITGKAAENDAVEEELRTTPGKVGTEAGEKILPGGTRQKSRKGRKVVAADEDHPLKRKSRDIHGEALVRTLRRKREQFYDLLEDM